MQNTKISFTNLLLFDRMVTNVIMYFLITEDTMKSITRYYRKVNTLFFLVVFIGCVVSLFSAPAMEKMFKKEIVEKFGYTIVINGVEVGQAATPQEAKEAFDAARLMMNKDGQIAYADINYEIYKTSDCDRITTVDNLTSDIYANISEYRITSKKDEAYTIRIDDYVVTLGSKEDVIALFEMVKDGYDTGDEFQVSLDTKEDGTLSIGLIKATVDELDTEIVSATLTGEGAQLNQEVKNPDAVRDGALLMGYAESITIIPTNKYEEDVTSLEDAFAAITKSEEEKKYHVVAAGDSLYGICNQYGLTIDQLLALNEGMTISSTIHKGDKIVVLVPKKELNVLNAEVVTYEESYNLPTIYRDNNTMYKGVYNTVSAGKTGYREVKAIVTYKDGIEISREIIVEEVITEAVAAVVDRGTVTPPTYINPFYGWAPVTSKYGYRTHPVTGQAYSFHTGVDFGVPSGTKILASRGGTVIRAAWSGGYGYCVDIRHSDGVVTRYAHLSRMDVYVGQKVSQGQVIARSGSTGQSTGPHLHFEIRINNGSTHVDPLKYLN